MSHIHTGYDKYLASPATRIHFAGWETDTYRLQQNGWQLSAVQDPYLDSIQIGFQHPEYRIRGITNRIRRDSCWNPHVGSYYQAPRRDEFWPPQGYPMEVAAQLASDFISHTATIAPFSKFSPIDAEPQWTEARQYMSQNMVFAPNLARTQEIIVPEQSVDDLLNMMLDRQASNRAELIRRRVREQGQTVDFNQRTNVHAQIVSIVA